MREHAGRADPDGGDVHPATPASHGTRLASSSIDPADGALDDGFEVDSLAAVSGRSSPWSQGERITPTIAGYEILGELGRGGMGIVYHARKLRLNRSCALKMILAGAHADVSTIVRFLAEAEAVARVQHPNIVQIFHVGEATGLPFLELEYVAGGSLADSLDGTPWPAGRAVALVDNLTKGMIEAHRLGILHRDLKPANVLMGDGDTPKITDFGLAKCLAVDSGLTGSNLIMGSPSYMSPEQALGQTDQIRPAADIYSLGAILYELLTGRPAFRGASVFETLALVRTAEPVPPSRLVPGLPRDLETIVLKCLQKEPGRRYASSAALAEDFRRLAAGETILARRSWVMERAWRWCRRNPALAALNALAVTLVVAIAVISTVAAVSLKHQRDQAQFTAAHLEFERRNARAAEEVARLERDRSDKLLYISNLRLAQQIWASDEGPARAVAGLLNRHVPTQSGQADLRDFTWRFGWTRLHRAALTWHADRPTRSGYLTPAGHLITLDARGVLSDWDPLTGHLEAERPLEPGPSPAGWVMATGGEVVALAEANLGSFRLLDPNDGHTRRAITGQAPIQNISFSPDGRYVMALWGDRQARVYDATTGAEQGSVVVQDGPHRCLGLTADGKTLIMGNHPGFGSITAYNLTTGSSTPLPPRPSTVLTIACTRDGRFATGEFNGTVLLWDGATLQPISAPLGGNMGNVTHLAFSPDAHLLASGDTDGQVVVWDVATRDRLFALKGHTERIGWLAFSRDARRLASVDTGGTQKVWNLEAPAGEQLLAGDVTPATRLAFAPDGQTLAIGGSAVRVRTIQGGAPVWSSLDRDDDPQRVAAISALAYSRNGSLLATGDLTSRVVVRDRMSGRPILTLVGMSLDFYGPMTGPFALSKPEFKRAVSALAFAPDDSVLAVGYGYRTGFVPNYAQKIKIWDPRSGQVLADLEVGNTVASLHFTTDGKLLRATCHDGKIRSWSVATWHQVGTLETKAEIASAAVSSDGNLLAAGLTDGSISTWDLAAGREVGRALGHSGTVVGVAFTPDGRTLASLGSQHRTLRFWDVATGAEMSSARLPYTASDLAFNEQGDLLTLATSQGIRLLPALPLDEIDAVRAAEAQWLQHREPAADPLKPQFAPPRL